MNSAGGTGGHTGGTGGHTGLVRGTFPLWASACRMGVTVLSPELWKTKCYMLMSTSQGRGCARRSLWWEEAGMD